MAENNLPRDVAAIESCLADKTEGNLALAGCTGTVVKACQSGDMSSTAEMDCTDRETEAWVAIYESRRDSLLQSARLQGIDGAMDALHQGIAEYEASLYRACPFTVGQWPADALLRKTGSFACVRDGEAERAVRFHFWDRDINALSAE